MDRRMMLALVGSAVAAAGPALAQTAMPAAGTSAGAAMGKAEIDHAMKTGMAGATSLKVANIGLEKATNPHVKQFAKLEHDEQTTMADVLTSMHPDMKPTPDPKMEPTVDKLSKMKPGKEFDQAFVAAQTDGHNSLLAIQDEYLKTGKDREHVNTTKLARGMVKEHLTLLEELKKML